MWGRVMGCNAGRAAVRRRLSVLIAATAVGIAASGAQAAEKAKPPQSIWEQETLTGDWGGARTALKDKGVDVTVQYIGETLNILSGGVQRGTTYEGRLEFTVETDLDKLIGWSGASTHVTVFQLHDVANRNAVDFTGSLGDPSNIDALPTTRLYTAWFQQELAGGAASIRAGQLAADDEFLNSTTAGNLINGTFGWAPVMASNLPSGGPAFPLATPGVRLKIKPSAEWSILAAVFSGDPAGAGCNDNPQACNRYGLTFSASGGALWMGEVQYQVNQEEDSKGLAAAYKLGGWFHTGDFADQRFGLDAAGALVSLAAPTAVAALIHRGDWGVYGVADQMVWRAGKRSVSLFARGGMAPSDRNLVSWYVDGGIGIKGLVAGREDDTLTFGVGHAVISKDSAALDADTLAISGPPYPIRDAETVFELSYIAQLAPWWTLQPDVQYFIHPGGNVPDPNNPAAAVRNAFLIGLRSTIKF